MPASQFMYRGSFREQSARGRQDRKVLLVRLSVKDSTSFKS